MDERLVFWWCGRFAAAFERIAVALERQAQALEYQLALEHVEASPPCPHPDSEREDLGSTMGHQRWRCKACGHEVNDEVVGTDGVALGHA